VGLKESHISQREFVQKDLVELSMKRSLGQAVWISRARKTRECNHGKGTSFIQKANWNGKRRKKWTERDKGMYAIQRKIGMCKVLTDKVMAHRLQTWMT
jgi:hypothetical protein